MIPAAVKTTMLGSILLMVIGVDLVNSMPILTEENYDDGIWAVVAPETSLEDGDYAVDSTVSPTNDTMVLVNSTTAPLDSAVVTDNGNSSGVVISLPASYTASGNCKQLHWLPDCKSFLIAKTLSRLPGLQSQH